MAPQATAFNEYGDQANPAFTKESGSLVFRYDAESVHIVPWGPNAFRIRATNESSLPDDDWALTERVDTPNATIEITGSSASITNGSISRISNWFNSSITSCKQLCHSHNHSR